MIVIAMANPSASALERVLACAPSQVLPAVFTTNDYAERGSQIGRFVRAVVGGTPVDVALLDVREEWRDTCRHLEWEKLAGDLSDVRGEMSYAFDVETWEATVLGSNLGRRYPLLRPSQIAGSDDIEGVRLDGIPVVRDLKSGGDVTSASENPQIKFFCLVRQIITGAPEVEGGIRYVREDGRVTCDDHVFSAFDLQCFGDELGEMVARVAEARRALFAGEPLTVSSGGHCTYCPAMQACPRYTALARTMAGDLQTLAGGVQNIEVEGDAETRRLARVEALRARFALMDKEAQGRAWLLKTEAKTLLADIDEALKAIARQDPIPLADGKLVKEIRFPKAAFSQQRAIAALRERGATEADIDACYVEAEQSQIRTVGGTPKKASSRRKRSAA